METYQDRDRDVDRHDRDVDRHEDRDISVRHLTATKRKNLRSNSHQLVPTDGAHTQASASWYGPDPEQNVSERRKHKFSLPDETRPDTNIIYIRQNFGLSDTTFHALASRTSISAAV